MAQNLVQYIVVRKDLLKSGWPTGALITQACHACVAVIHQFYDKEDTQKYLGDVDRMHKVTLEATDEESIVKLSETLSSKGIDHKLWIEQPENIPTCIATRPYVKENIQENFKKFKLFKA